MMVAFDLEEVASQGSLAFIQDFLIPTVLKQTGAQIQGELQQCLTGPGHDNCGVKVPSFWTRYFIITGRTTARMSAGSGPGSSRELWRTSSSPTAGETF